ncbi:NADH-quinone oxidoreductase subunit C [Lichenihabitans sp. Uapishka_5]|uniref:NADH-quinone oxidoreductase subunit C n=1 Tax=Lichenihabitans sp. Uapishka_5 TaxID=3037302 RepID=UPI0029E80D35|nr:NADH-quinone oxidoreductase subunit C [Lichenihabitans sp. Uapishka_5]MDX7951201.1 NADH-quinone oxidoreductase subunit C [Lichenihabitans sp. Uapishka_5]
MSVEQGSLEAFGAAIMAALPDAGITAGVRFDELTLSVKPEGYVALVRHLRDDALCLFINFVDLCGVDYPQRPKRFDVVLHLLSPKFNRRVRVKTMTDETTPLPSLIEVFPSANWFEREAYDLYGILFSGHPDLRRILTDYGFEGHPLRKDFPMTGFVEVRWDDQEKRVVNEPVRLTQEFRNWDFESPWEGIETAALPGDEKATQ